MSKRKTTEQFIKESEKVHNGKYNYSKVEYIDSKTKVCIICPEHGEFWQTPDNHLRGKGCPKCHPCYEKTTEWFIEKARQINGDKYDYSKVEYKGYRNKVCIICPEHGEFWQNAANHLKGYKCPKCAGNYSLTTQEFINKCKKIHGDKYDYSKVEYKGVHEKVCIICPEHGEFWQEAGHHLRGANCPECSKKLSTIKKSTTQEDFLKTIGKIYGDKYDFSKINYKNAYTKVCVICPKHGEYWTEPTNLLKGCGCRKCYNESLRLTNDKFLEKAREIHGDKYDYSKVEYKGYNEKVCIICPEHGEFWQTPAHHLKGCGCQYCSKNKNYSTEEFISLCKERFNYNYDYSKVKYKNWRAKICITCPEHGDFFVIPNNFLRGRKCPKCSESNLETTIRTFLEKNNIKYIYECNKTYFKWLGLQHLDFYLPEYNVAIECQGEQHFYAVDFAGKGKKWAIEKLKQTKELDEIKKKKCIENGVKLLQFSNKKYSNEILIEEKEITDYLKI